MTEKTWKVFRILAALSVLFVFIDYRITLGYLLGACASLVTLKRIERFCDAAIRARYSSNVRAFGGFMVNYMIMAAVLTAAAVFRNVFNIFAAALGLMAIKLSVILESVIYREKEAAHGD